MIFPASDFHPAFLPIAGILVAFGGTVLGYVHRKVGARREVALADLKVAIHARGWHDAREIARHMIEGAIGPEQFSSFAANNPGVSEAELNHVAAGEKSVVRYRRARLASASFIVLPLLVAGCFFVALYVPAVQWMAAAGVAATETSVLLWALQ